MLLVAINNNLLLYIMDIKGVAIGVFIFLVLLYIIINAFSKTTKLSEMSDGTILQTIEAAKLKNKNPGSNFTYSMWIYINDWNYRYGEDKIILNRESCPKVVLDKKKNKIMVNVKCISVGTDSTPASYTPYSCAEQAKNVEACNACKNGFSCACVNCNQTDFDFHNGIVDPSCASPASIATAINAAITKVTNATAAKSAADAAKSAGDSATPAMPDLEKNALAKTATDAANALTTAQSEYSLAMSLRTGKGAMVAESDTNVHSCVVDNISIQKWVNIIVSLYNLTLDIYIDGKLVRTCILPGVPKNNNNSAIQITPGGGFRGWTTTFKFFPYASNPQAAFNLYKDGYGGSIVGNAISKYRLRVSAIKNNEVQTSFEI